MDEKSRENKKELFNKIKSGLRETIQKHGLIDKKLIGSAAKRILGKLKQPFIFIENRCVFGSRARKRILGDSGGLKIRNA